MLTIHAIRFPNTQCIIAIVIEIHIYWANAQVCNMLNTHFPFLLTIHQYTILYFAPNIFDIIFPSVTVGDRNE